ncbi:S8 family serine peptidase [Hyalangium rubrum]|uniref:S8 family serine peptidase n=1 Tax=Hyalangium rubrum TaxID=3103134 RepID=A0ABU5GYQ8_9BACT|nr:S8 family serine peptidase [Hyalangium sp. s54d21]MDY7226290.1 S8 family serine peptidase [Hyalangium sp. s54d21]
MKGFKSLGLVVTTTLLGCGAGPSSEPAAADTSSPATRASAAVHAKKKIVNSPVASESACSAFYSSPQAQAALTQAVVDPGLQADGSVRTLILSFNEDAALPAALNTLTGTLGLVLGQNLGALQELPMVAVSLPITPSLLNTLKQQLQPLGLISIYENRPLHYFLDVSNTYIRADTARSAFQVTGQGVGVGVIDSGIDGTHGDFPNVVANVKVVGNVLGTGIGGALYIDTPNSDLTSGHGTHVASTIGGSGARSNGLYKGVAPGAKLVGVGVGDAINILFALEGFDYLMDPDVREAHNVRIISNSWGTSGSHFAPFDPVSIASKRAYDAGMIVAFAAGNDGPGADTLNPYSASPCVISVAAGTSRDTRGATNPLLSQDAPGELVDFSSRGIPGDALHHPDITLPGVNIVAARATTALPAVAAPYLGLDGLHPEPFYAALSGTSMATPHLSGVVALMLEANPTLNMDGVLAALTSTAKPIYVQEANGTTRLREEWEAGAGYADAYAAVKAAASTAGTRYTTTTTPLPGWTGTVSTSVRLPVLDLTLVSAEHNHTLTVPAGKSALRISTNWGNPGFDLDMYVYGPNGNLVATSAAGTSAGEAVSIPNPAAGTYRIQLKGFLNGPTSYTGTAAVDQLVPLP